jgi:O-antigen/teichoic acid export membrane protein
VTTTRLIARNTVWNVAGQVVPMFAAIIAIPVLIRDLGAPRFGVLTLAWAAIGYFSLFDLGLGRALTQAVAARLSNAEQADDLPAVVWTALVVMTALGFVGGVVLGALTPWFAGSVMHIPASLLGESRGAFYLLAISMPAVVVTAGLRGLMEAHQDFAIATALRIPLALFTFIAPMAVLPFSHSLVPIVGVLVVGRYATCAAHLAACMQRYRYLRTRPVPQWEVLVPLLRLGGWMTASNIASPIMSYLDRFFIGAVLAMTAVAHYVTPYEIVTKVLIVPTAMIAVMFPVFASTYADNPERTSAVYERALRILILVSFPLLLTVVLFAREALTLWVGAPFAGESAPVMRWLAVGIFANAVAQAPFALLQGTGRPDLTAKLHLVELPIYVLMLWWLAHTAGIVGVAIAWTVRVVIDTVAMQLMASRRIPGLGRLVEPTLLIALLGLATLIGACYVDAFGARVLLFALAMPGFAVFAWTRLLQPAERAFLLGRVRV